MCAPNFAPNEIFAIGSSALILKTNLHSFNRAANILCSSDSESNVVNFTPCSAMQRKSTGLFTACAKMILSTSIPNSLINSTSP